MKRKNHKKLFILAGFLGVITLLNSCTKVNGDGPVVSENRNIQDFSGIHYALQGNLHILNSTESNVEIRAQQNIINVIETYVINNNLYIQLRNNTQIRSYEPIDIYIKCSDPEIIRLSGSGNIWVPDPVSPQKLTLESSGSGHIKIENIQSEVLNTHLSGSGKIEVVSGHAKVENILLSGSGQALLSGVMTDSAFSKTSGSGYTTLWVTKYMDCEISGSGIVRYKGSPVIKKRISGSGDIFSW